MLLKRLFGVMVAVDLMAAGAAGIAPAAIASAARVAPQPFMREIIQAADLHTPPTTAQCLANPKIKIHCYQPSQLSKAYGLDKLHAAGIDGRGRTIVIVDSFGSPTIAADLHAFDAAFGIPDPPSLVIRQDAGPVPLFDNTNADMLGWASETTLDVEWAHVFAPGAKIVVEETPVSETEGVQGFPEIVKAENYVIDHGIGDVISQSFGATEETFPSPQSILDLRSAFKNARKHHVTVLGSSGDTGAANYFADGSCCYANAVNSWPSSDPLVTSIGGTQLHLDAAGVRLSPDSVWNDPNAVVRRHPNDPATCCAGGGGVSSVFKRPGFQEDVASVTGAWRGTPDISLSAALDGAVLYYHTFADSDAQTASGPWHLVGGTSESSPEFAGIVAMADQVAGRRLGWINPAMYGLGSEDSGIVDVTTGNNTYKFFDANNTLQTVQGYNAVEGYDLASGLGTVNADQFVRALADRQERPGDGGDGGGG